MQLSMLESPGLKFPLHVRETRTVFAIDGSSADRGSHSTSGGRQEKHGCREGSGGFRDGGG